MARKPFDPSLAAGGLFDKPASPLPAKEDPNASAALGVSALSLLIRNALEGGVGTVRVVGEMSNFRAVQGHWYFSLKDADARIDCMMFRSAADRSACKPTDGIEVIITGQVTHYPPQGRTQIQCAKVELAGAGDLDAQFRQLCLELRGLGYFDDSAKVKIPAMPMCIALLTSAGSAAEADCLDAARQTFPSTKIIAVDIRVQGTNAAQGIARAITAVDTSAKRLGIEVILLVRGGGSREDLWAFNERVVADAIRRCVTPIVTGIG
ncbi:MAG: exodeoxyribonuclease VII large subunit, partial [Planctomycetes bacterium]|nr:exodeoxyribonuclease VII large subunit [Planctomycetota bacterium]